MSGKQKLHHNEVVELAFKVPPTAKVIGRLGLSLKAYLKDWISLESNPHLFSCSTQLRLKFILLINVKMPTIVGILTFMSRINY